MFLQAPMLFRLLLVLSVLLAPAEGAPIFIRNPRSHEQIRIKEENVTAPPETSEDTVYRIVIPAAIILIILAVIIGDIAIFYCCLKKKKPMQDAESQYCADNFTESNTKLNGDHEVKRTVTNEDVPPRHEEVEVKESKMNPDLNDYKQTPPSILKGRNPMKNLKTGKNVSFQESDDQYVYIYDSESSQPGYERRYLRRKQCIKISDHEVKRTVTNEKVEVKASEMNPDLNDYKQTPPSILKGRNPMKNVKTGKNVSFQESDDQYVYIYDSESSQPGYERRYSRYKTMH